MYVPNKIALSVVDYNQQLKRFDTQPNEPAIQNSRKFNK